MQPRPLYTAVLAGGSGTRFWPASRKRLPKQFLPIAAQRSMLAETIARLDGLVPLERVLVVTCADQTELVREALPELPADNLVVEPAARNTAPCVALAAFEIARRDPESVFAVLPADHVIEPVEAFRRSLELAVEVAEDDVLITFGITPTFAATGYGYIEAGAPAERAREVVRFVEKPDAQRAAEFVASGRFFWNGGMFVWKTKAILDAFERHSPAVHAGLVSVANGADLSRVYPSLPAQPVDIAVMERADNIRVIPVDYHWNDVGSWAAIADVTPGDADDNRAAGGGALIAEDARNCITYGKPGELVALLGVEDLVVAHSDGITLVCPRDRAQDVKRLVARLEAERPDDL